jgi:hypothetical protein
MMATGDGVMVLCKRVSTAILLFISLRVATVNKAATVFSVLCGVIGLL